MNVVELANDSYWRLETSATEQTVYTTASHRLDKLETIDIDADSPNCIEIAIDHQLSVPNLKFLLFKGAESLRVASQLIEKFNSRPQLLGIYFCDTGLTRIPKLIIESPRMNELIFRNEQFSEIPGEIFKLGNLQMLRLEYTRNITIVPDDVVQLPNLETFSLWQADIAYLSPHLFLLPKIRSISFAYCRYTPSAEVSEALEVFKSRPGSFFQSW